MRMETQILSNLISNDEYCRKVVPHLKVDYFSDRQEAAIAAVLLQFYQDYNKPASPSIIQIELSNLKGFNDKEVPEMLARVAAFDPTPEANQDWLLSQTEKFCKDRAVYNAILGSIKIIEGRDTTHTQDAIPNILSEALSICFDTNIGHDYLEDAQSRFDYYHRVEEKIPFDLEMFNRITGGGVSKKTLNIALAGTGVGKSLFMCHVAAGALSQGRDVLYITLEMAEEKIAERIDANLLNFTMDDLKTVERGVFESRINKLTAKTTGKLIVKEYPTASAHAGHFRALLEELKMKRGFKPEIIMIDYLNICASQRMKMGASVNSYTYIKSIAEELRGLAVEYDVPIFSATQTTRSGFTNSDPGLEDTSESFGLPATADFMFALVTNEQLEALGQILVKQLKNRYNDPNRDKRFIIGVDRSKMKLYDVEESAQAGLSDSGQNNVSGNSPQFPARLHSSEGFSGFKF